MGVDEREYMYADELREQGGAINILFPACLIVYHEHCKISIEKQCLFGFGL